MSFFPIVLTLIWVVLLLFSHIMVQRTRDGFQSQSGPWLSEDPCSESRIPMELIRQSVIKFVSDSLPTSSPYFLPLMSPNAIRVHRAWSNVDTKGIRWRFEVDVFLVNRDNSDTEGVCIRIQLKSSDQVRGVLIPHGSVKIVERNLTSDRVLLLSQIWCPTPM